MLLKAVKYLLKVLPAPAGVALARQVSTSPQRAPVSPQEQQALAQAKTLRYGPGGGKVAWMWGEQGPLVILVHGWGGRAAQMAPLALALAGRGFRAAAFDISGHGESTAKRTSWTCFLTDIHAFTEALGEEVHAYVAHSAGALSTMAARQLKGIRATRYVCVCGPSHPFPPIDVLKAKLAPPPRVVEGYKRHIASQFDSSWERLASGVSFQGAGDDLLLVFDTRDRFVPHTEGDRIHALCPDSRLVKTETYGHVRILGSTELADLVGDFLERGQGSAGQGFHIA